MKSRQSTKPHAVDPYPQTIRLDTQHELTGDQPLLGLLTWTATETTPSRQGKLYALQALQVRFHGSWTTRINSGRTHMRCAWHLGASSILGAAQRTRRRYTGLPIMPQDSLVWFYMKN